MAVIIPCAGKSSRFPDMRPKYLLTMFDGELMLEKACRPYMDQDIHIAILKEHNEKYNVLQTLQKVFNDSVKISIHVLENETSGPAETVAEVCKSFERDTSIFIKDCDSFFDRHLTFDNHVCVVDLRENLHITKVAAKSFVQTDNQDIINNIVEKEVVSNFICVGGYSFESAYEFIDTFQKIKQNSEIFISHIVKKMLQEKTFVSKKVANYVDVGTYDEFVNFNQQRATIFCDIDGTIFKNQSKHFENNWGNTPEVINSAVEYLLEKQDTGSKIIFTTSRSEKYKNITEKTLDKCGFKDYIVIYDLLHAPRILINDYSKSNPYPTAISINVPRDDNDYWRQLK